LAGGDPESRNLPDVGVAKHANPRILRQCRQASAKLPPGEERLAQQLILVEAERREEIVQHRAVSIVETA
jgi:hypothetical protein